jgi:hypothetical protein
MLRKLPILLCMVAMLIGFTIDYTTQRNINITLSPLQSDKNTAIYAAYSEDGTISDYVVTYLKKLKEIAPNIIYVTDNQMSKNELRKIKPYANHVIAHRHGEYDWGSFKRGYNWLIAQNSPQDLKQKAEGFATDGINGILAHPLYPSRKESLDNSHHLLYPPRLLNLLLYNTKLSCLY